MAVKLADRQFYCKWRSLSFRLFTMGNTSSKAVRKLPKRTETPTWAGARATNPSSEPSEAPRLEIPRAIETKNEGKFTATCLITQPHLLYSNRKWLQRPSTYFKYEKYWASEGRPPHAKLSPSESTYSLVYKHIEILLCICSQENLANKMHRIRVQSEVEANPSHPIRNRILSSTLSNLLGARKSWVSRTDIEAFENHYGIDVDKLESLARFVNTPSIDEGSRRKTVDENGVEVITSKVSAFIFYWILFIITVFRLYGKNGLIDDVTCCTDDVTCCTWGLSRYIRI